MSIHNFNLSFNFFKKKNPNTQSETTDEMVGIISGCFVKKVSPNSKGTSPTEKFLYTSLIVFLFFPEDR